MPFLIVTILVLFVGVEFFQWLRGVILPLPLYVLGGAFLAIASNYEKGIGLPLVQNIQIGSPPLEQITVVDESPLADPPLLESES